MKARRYTEEQIIAVLLEREDVEGPLLKTS